MALRERDPHTGHMMTGHEWNGIKELNTPVPKVVWFFLAATFLFSVGYWILMPSFPSWSGYAPGVMGADDRKEVTEVVAMAAASREVWMARVEAESYDAIRADDALMQSVRGAGKTLFGDNCAVCHGVDAKGGKGYPNLTDAAWLWGGAPEEIETTIALGVNAPVEGTRTSQMMAFGRDAMIPRGEIANVVTYVQSLSGKAPDAAPEALEAGRKTFADNCAACHGDAGKGSVEVGAPDLTDDDWLYGGDRASIYESIWSGRQGHMPHWNERLTAADRKLLTLYILDLGAGR